MQKSSTISKTFIEKTLNESLVFDSNAHNSILSFADSINKNYNISSVLEDIVTTKYLALKSKIENINMKKFLFLKDSFITSEIFDKDFPLDVKLDIDEFNGNCILKSKESVDLQIDAVIVNSITNGEENKLYPIKNLQSFSNNYSIIEKTSSKKLSSPLLLGLTLKLKEIDICNSLYIKFYSNSQDFPSIQKIEISEDGLFFTEISTDTIIGKTPDVFLRFLPQKVKYILIVFEQLNYSQVGDSPTLSYKYEIGVRSIIPKKISYEISGEYVSRSFNTENMKNITFEKKDISNGDINYFYSSDNGSRWIKLIQGGNEIFGSKNTRIKISMDKRAGNFGQATSEEFFQNSMQKMMLLNTPMNYSLFIGNHISFGKRTSYKINLFNIENLAQNNKLKFQIRNVTFDTNITKLLLSNNGELVSQDIWEIIKDETSHNNCILNIKDTSTIKNGLLELYYSPLEFRGENGQIITLPYNIFLKDNNSIGLFVDGIECPSSLFTIISDNKIKISDELFNKYYTYTVLYSPEIELKISTELKENIITILDTTIDTKQDSKIKVKYTYGTGDINNISEFYTPVCNEYKVVSND